MKTILVPVDLSDATTKVCDVACNLARLLKARVILLHVVHPAPVLMGDLYGYNDNGALADAMNASEKAMAEKLRALARRYHKRGRRIQTVQRTGHPAQVILEKAEECNADYIVLGSHGHTAAYDLLIGSAAQGVLRKAGCPVMVVPMFSTSTKRRAK